MLERVNPLNDPFLFKTGAGIGDDQFVTGTVYTLMFDDLPGSDYYSTPFAVGDSTGGGLDVARFADYLVMREYTLARWGTGLGVYHQVFDENMRAIGRQYYSDYDDSNFWAGANIAKSIVTGGVAAWSAAGSAVASGEAAASTAPIIKGGSMDMGFDFADFGGYDYSSSFEPFDFSSGEGFQVFSDAQNVDFGIGAGFGDFQSPLDWNFAADPGFNFNLTDVLNATPETGVSDFGTWWSNPALDTVKDAAVKAGTSKLIAAAVGPAKPAPVQSQSPITTKSISNGVQDLVGAAMNIIKARDAYSGTATQRETARSRTYSGQLAANPQPIAGGVNPWVLALGGVVLVGGIIYVSRKG